MVKKDRILHAVLQAVDEVNAQLPPTQQLEKDCATILLGKSGKLDSLGLVSLIVATEDKLLDEFGVSVTLADERAMSQAKSPFRTIGALADYIATVMPENRDE